MATKTKPAVAAGASLAAKHQILKNQAETPAEQPQAPVATVSPEPQADTDPLLMVTDLMDQLEVLRPQAIEQILHKRQALDVQLAKLGYQAVPGGAKLHTVPFRPMTTSKTRSTGGSTGYNPAKVCPICGEAGHDGRKHRFDQQKPAQTKETSTAPEEISRTLPAGVKA